MADRAQLTKSLAFVAIGQPDVAKLSKAVAYFVLEPGDGGEDTSNRQGHVHTQIIRRH